MSIRNRIQPILEDAKRVVRDPVLFGLGLNKLYYRIVDGDSYNKGGTDVFDEDWDTLILLDACRYDEYAALTPFDGFIETRISRGSTSRQFVRGNFTGKRLHDVVYVSGNQWYLKLREELDCELHAYHDVERDAADGYVPSPEAITNAALELAERYPAKRLLVHYMQPHKPYLGGDDDLFSYPRGEGLRGTMRASSADRQDLKAAYRANLRLVLESVEKLVAELDGKTVISADHGELLGDRMFPVPVRWYGHPGQVYMDELTEIPWHVVSDGPRRNIESEPSNSESVDSDPERVESTLRDLGYLG